MRMCVLVVNCPDGDARENNNFDHYKNYSPDLISALNIDVHRVLMNFSGLIDEVQP